ncbi:MAG: MBL fold metallo-hydrolase [Eubacteriales bacterium]|nr:MBL fold metallo-hydrolase [Eubacteriales bacterium]
MPPEKTIQITLLANEGIIVTNGRTKFLIDGLHENNGEFFSGLSRLVRQDLLAGEKPLFQSIDYLLFSHCHYDHFSATLTQQYLENHQIKGLFLPDQSTKEFSALRETAHSRADQTWLVDLPLGQKQTFQLEKDISVTVFRSVHAGHQFIDVEHYCYLLDLAGYKLFIIADSHDDAAYFAKMLAGETIDVALVNPMFINRYAGRAVIGQALKPQQIIVYHIPFEDHSRHGFRKIVPHDITKYQAGLPPISILWDELQTMELR